MWSAKDRKLYGLNASGRSPKTLTLDHFKKLGLKHILPTGPLPVSVPGAVDGWFELHGRFGKLPMKALLAPAIRYADEGFPVSEVIPTTWVAAWPPWAGSRVSGRPMPWTASVPPGPARSSATRAWPGPWPWWPRAGGTRFYKGAIARRIDAYMKAHGGFLSYEDLAAHHSDWVEPVSVNYRGYDVWEIPGNGQGLATLQMLNILEGYDFSRIPFGSVRHVHLVTEAKKLVFEDRAKFYADPAFVKVPVQGLLSKDTPPSGAPSSTPCAPRAAWRPATRH